MATQRLPKAVSNAAANADRLLKELEEGTKDLTDETPEVVDNTQAEVIDLKPNIQPEVTANVEVKPDPTQPDKTAQYWEHRFKTLQGIQEAEKRRFLSESAQQNQRFTELEKKLAEKPVQVVPKEYDIRQYIPQDVLESYGNDLPKAMLAMATKVGKEISDETVSTKFKPEVDSLRQDINKITLAAQEQRKNYFWESLETAVPDYKITNVDPAFHTWLSEFDPVAGAVRQELLGNAEANLNARQVVSIFKAFENQRKPAVPQVPARQPTKVIPESSPSPAPSVDTGQGPPIMSIDDFSRISSELARGKYNKNPGLKVKLEKQIDEAIRTGRIG